MKNLLAGMIKVSKSFGKAFGLAKTLLFRVINPLQQSRYTCRQLCMNACVFINQEYCCSADLVLDKMGSPNVPYYIEMGIVC